MGINAAGHSQASTADTSFCFAMAEGGESPLSEFEEKCCQEIDREGDEHGRSLKDGNDRIEERLWTAFQEAARAVTNLCRGELAPGVWCENRPTT